MSMTRTREGITRSAGDPAGSPPPRTPPPAPPSPLNYLHSAVAVPLIYLYTVVMGTLSLLLSVRDAGGRRQHWCASTWSRMIARTAGMSVRVHGAGRLREGA